MQSTTSGTASITSGTASITSGTGSSVSPSDAAMISASISATQAITANSASQDRIQLVVPAVNLNSNQSHSLEASVALSQYNSVAPQTEAHTLSDEKTRQDTLSEELEKKQKDTKYTETADGATGIGEVVQIDESQPVSDSASEDRTPLVVSEFDEFYAPLASDALDQYHSSEEEIEALISSDGKTVQLIVNTLNKLSEELEDIRRKEVTGVSNQVQQSTSAFAENEITNSLICQECSKSFLKKSNLKEHIGRVHKGVKFKCDQCSKSYTTKGSLKSHISKKHTKKNINQLDSLAEAMKKRAVQTQEVVNEKKESDLSESSLTVTEIYAGKNTNKLKRNVETNSVSNQPSCSYLHPGRGHMEISNDQGNDPTPAKKAKYDREAVVSSSENEDSAEVTVVSYTGNKAQNSSDKKKDDGLICPDCFKFFLKKSNLKEHIERVHKGVRFKCAQCSKLYATKVSLLLHIREKHTSSSEAERFICNACPESFTTIWNRNDHIRRQHGAYAERYRFVCGQCLELFTTNQSKNRHIIRQHGISSERYKFICNQCSKSFTSSWSRNAHIKSKHLPSSERERFICNYCFNSYLSEKSRRRHMEEKHDHVYTIKKNDYISMIVQIIFSLKN